MASTSREFDILLWGVTGYTGGLACEYVARTYGLPTESLKYAIAARTESRLDAVEKKMIDIAKTHDKAHGLLSVTKIIANVQDEASIVSMCNRAKVVCAFAGPYSACGEPIVKACAENGVHYIDCTAEIDWVVRMRQLYNSKAVATKAKIVSGCGVFCIPNEVAMLLLNKSCKENNLELHSAHQMQQLALATVSGGTLRSLFGKFKSIPLAKIWDTVCYPFSLCEESPRQAVVEANKLPLLGISRRKDINAWISLSPLSPLVGNYLRWSNEVQNFPWGRDLVIKVSQINFSIFTAFLSAVSCWCFPVALFVLARLPFLTRFFPASGAACCKGSKDKSSFVEVLTTADAKQETSNVIKHLTVKASFPFDGYEFSALAVVESALAAVHDETTNLYGVVSPSGALGHALVRRLAKQGCTFSEGD